MDDFEAAGLYDPKGPRAAERRELIEHLLSRFPADRILEMSAEVPAYVIAMALSEVRTTEWISAREVAKRCGVTTNEVAEFRLALGWPVTDVDQLAIPETATEDLALYLIAKQQFGSDAVNTFTRILGATVARMTEAGRAMVSSGATAAGPLPPTELELSIANEFSTAAWTALPTMIGHMMFEHTTNNLDFLLSLVDENLVLAVVFVDLVAFTTWTASIDANEHARALARFERAAWETARRAGGRLVKLIGDEAMIVAETADAGCQIAAELSAFADADADLPAAAAAVGYGPVTARGGDYFGHLVNVVARAINIAGANEVLVTTEVISRLDGSRWATTDHGAHSLKGVAEPVALHAVTRVASA